MAYLLARIDCNYGKAGHFAEVMAHLVPALERSGWRLLGAYAVQIGRLNRVYDLWEVADANGVRSALELARQDPEFREWAAKLPEINFAEQLELLEKLPYSP